MHTLKAELMFSRSRLKGFFCFILFVFQSGSSGKVQKVIAKLGDEAKLPCEPKIPPGESIKNYKIYWQKDAYPSPLVAIAYADGQEDPHIDESYQNRTKMNEQNLTLSIFPVIVSDKGLYNCHIIKDLQNNKGSVNLSVEADYIQPTISVEKAPNVCGSTWLTLTCSSHGGYPSRRMFGSVNNEAVEWNSTSTSDNKTARFQITGKLQLNVTKDILVQCSIENQTLQTSANFSLSVTEECVPSPLPTMPLSHGILIASAVIFIFLLAGVIMRVSCCCHNRKYSRSSCPISSFQPVATVEMTQQQISNETSF